METPPQTSLTLPPPAAAVSADRKGGVRPSGAPALAQLEGQRTPPVPPGQGHGVLGSVLRGAGVGGTRGKETNCALATPPPPRSGPEGGSPGRGVQVGRCHPNARQRGG